MQHEFLCPPSGGQAFSARTDDIPQKASAAMAPSATESEPQGEDATPPEETTSPMEAPGETHEADPAVRPPIAPPRSWTKDARARWLTLPREIQQYVASREQERERELRRSQNEAAAKLKSLANKEHAAEQVRQKYESALPAFQQALQRVYATMFADITSVQDANRLAIVDPSRFKQWQVYREQIDTLEQELQRAGQRQVKDHQLRWVAFANEQDRLFLLRAPELSDPAHAQRAMNATARILKEIGFNDDELKRAWRGELFFSLRDHRIQWLVFGTLRYREQSDTVAAAKSSVLDFLSPVRRQATASAHKAVASDKGAATFIQTLEQQLATASGLAALKLGAMLTELQQHPTAQ